MSKETGGAAFPRTLWTGHRDNFNFENIPGMDLRPYAAIELRIPDSGLPWLDKMIAQAERRDVAGRALPGLISGLMMRHKEPGYDDAGAIYEAVVRSYDAADAMIAEGNKGE